MDDQYSGNMLVTLEHTVDGNQDIPRLEVAIGGQIVSIGGLRVCVGPEVIESWKRIEAEKQAANASGTPSAKARWQTRNSVSKVFMKAVARKAGFPGLFD